MTRRHFTQEYQDQAVSLVRDSGRTIRDVAKCIGVHELTLGKWVNKAKDSGSSQDKELSETERAELERLRKETQRKHSGPCGALPVSRVCLGRGCGHVCCDCGRCGS